MGQQWQCCLKLPQQGWLGFVGESTEVLLFPGVFPSPLLCLGVSPYFGLFLSFELPRGCVHRGADLRNRCGNKQMFWFLLRDNQVTVSNSGCFPSPFVAFYSDSQSESQDNFDHRSKCLERCQGNDRSPLTENSLAPFLLKIMRRSGCINHNQICIK